MNINFVKKLFYILHLSNYYKSVDKIKYKDKQLDNEVIVFHSHLFVDKVKYFF